MRTVDVLSQGQSVTNPERVAVNDGLADAHYDGCSGSLSRLLGPSLRTYNLREGSGGGAGQGARVRGASTLSMTQTELLKILLESADPVARADAANGLVKDLDRNVANELSIRLSNQDKAAQKIAAEAFGDLFEAARELAVAIWFAPHQEIQGAYKSSSVNQAANLMREMESVLLKAGPDVAKLLLGHQSNSVRLFAADILSRNHEGSAP